MPPAMPRDAGDERGGKYRQQDSGEEQQGWHEGRLDGQSRNSRRFPATAGKSNDYDCQPEDTGRYDTLTIEIAASGRRTTVRGIFPLSQIARQLGVAIYTD